MRPASLIVLALLAAAPLAAQGDSLTLEAAVALARRHSPVLEAAGGRRLIMEGSARQEAAYPNPVVELREENLGGPMPRDVFATVSVGLDLTGRRFAARAATRAANQRGALDSLADARDVEYLVVRGWWNAALARGLHESAVAQRAALDGMAAFEERRLREGAVAEGVVLRTRLEADRARLLESSARAESQRAHAELSRLIGVVPESLPPVAGLAGADVAFVASGPAPPGTPPLDAMVRQALERRPEVRAAAAAVEQARARLSAERRAALPDVGLIAGYKRTGGYDTHIVGAAVALPLFDGNGGARERAAGELQLATAQARAIEARVRAEVTASVRAFAELLDAARGGTGPEPMAARGAEVARVAQAAYREGGASLIEVLDAQRAAADARAAALRWLVDLRLAQLDLNRATGAPIVETR